MHTGDNDAVGHPVSEARIIQALKTVHDPEIPLNLYDLGLIYKIDIQASGRVRIDMTLTSPGCPVAGSLVAQVADKVRSVDGVTDAAVELVWDPPWSKERMTEAARLALNIDDVTEPPRRSAQFFDINVDRPNRP